MGSALVRRTAVRGRAVVAAGKTEDMNSNGRVVVVGLPRPKVPEQGVGPSGVSVDGMVVLESDPDKVPATAALKLRLLVQRLDKGEVPTASELMSTMAWAADILLGLNRTPGGEKSGEEQLSNVRDAQVREWLSSTFTRQDSAYAPRSSSKVPTFRTVAKALVIGQYIDSIYREGTVNAGPPYPAGVAQLFQDRLDCWDFDIFHAESLLSGQPLRLVGFELFKRHNLLKKHKISAHCLNTFLMEVERGYSNHGNPYHNATHGADVVQTVHYLVHSTGLEAWLSSLEILALLLAAVIHDLDHTGTTNAFHVQSYSDYALCYNDRSVLENHHLCTAFKLLKKEDQNILKNLRLEEFQFVRGLVIDMVLATDMSLHFEQLKEMRQLLSGPDTLAQLEKPARSKVLCQLLHMADISHPGKPWALHCQWTSRLVEEFFRQGDQERVLGLPCSPLCDRTNTDIPQSQLGFIDYIVGPSFEVCGDMLELLLATPSLQKKAKLCNLRVWAEPLHVNRNRWEARNSAKEYESVNVHGGEWQKVELHSNSVETHSQHSADMHHPWGVRGQNIQDVGTEADYRPGNCH